MFIDRYFNLQIFAEGAGGDGGAAAGSAAPAEGVSPTQDTNSKNPLAYVQYGKPAEQPAEEAPVDRNAEFEKLIKGEYKEQYNQRISETVKSRLKANQATVDKYNEASPMFEMLAQKYGVSDASDIKALMKALEEDSSFYEDEALEKGLSVEQLKEIKKMERENASLKREMEQKATQQQAEQIYARWQEESTATKKIYPSFDLNAELSNEQTGEQFKNLLRSNIPVQTAFEVIHKDEIIPAAMQYTAQQVEQKLTNKIISGGMRPAEGGTSNSASAVVKTDVSQLTKADRAEIIRRVRMGEKISF